MQNLSLLKWKQAMCEVTWSKCMVAKTDWFRFSNATNAVSTVKQCIVYQLQCHRGFMLSTTPTHMHFWIIPQTAYLF